MKEYIEREAVLRRMQKIATEAWKMRIKANVETVWNEAQDVLRFFPAADVRPVKRGEWERMFDNDVFGDIHCKCSACGEDWWQGPGWFRNANFCPNCGADMMPQPPKEE